MNNTLPKTYQEVEYLESSGIQYIDTEFKPSNNTKTIFKYMSFNMDKWVYGSRTSVSSIDKHAFLVNNGSCYPQFGNFASAIMTAVSTLNNIHVGINGNDGSFLDNIRLHGPINDQFQSDLNIYLFGLNQNNVLNRLFLGRIYNFQIFENGIINKYFIPCYRKSDNVAGMYELVNNVFYTNKGTGSFIIGPDVVDNDKNVVTKEIDWTQSMNQTFEYYEVDPSTWKDRELLKTIKSSSINRDLDTDTLGSAAIDVTDMLGESYIRIYLVISQNGLISKIPLGIFLVQTPTSSFDGKTKNVTMDAYTPLLELKENPVPLGYGLLKDENIMARAYQIIKNYCRAPVIETTSVEVLEKDFIANTSDTWLRFVIDLITVAKYELNLDEMGRILFEPIRKIEELQPVWTFDDDNSSILYPEMAIKHDLYGIPNVVEVVASIGQEIYTARVENTNINSPTSIQNRGREILYRELSPKFSGIPTTEMVDEYAETLLKTLSSVEYEISYSHGYCPVRIGDCVRLNYKKAELIDVKAKVVSQSIRCETGCSVSERAIFTKNIWK